MWDSRWGRGEVFIKKKRTKEATIIGGWGSPCLSRSQVNWLQLMLACVGASAPVVYVVYIEDRELRSEAHVR